jgi:hypothetical protein
MPPTATDEDENKAEQTELPNMPPKSAAGKAAQEYLDYKHKLEDQDEGLLKRKTAVHEAIKKTDKESMRYQCQKTNQWYVFSIKTEREKLSIRKEKEGFGPGK